MKIAVSTATPSPDYSYKSAKKNPITYRFSGGDPVLQDDYVTELRRSAMRLTHALCVFLVTVCATTSAVAQSMSEADTNAFEVYVLQNWEKYSAYMNDGNVDDWLKMWDENGVQLAPGAPAFEGIAAITVSITAQHAASDFGQFEIMNQEVEVSGDLGFARGTYSFIATPKEGGDEQHFEGKYLTIFKRQADGNWKIYRDCFNPNS
jgi:ketosteroid isomerase-like protein